MRKQLGALLALACVAALGAWPAGAVSPPQQFAARVDNPWFPLLPGTTFVYRGAKDGEPRETCSP